MLVYKYNTKHKLPFSTILLVVLTLVVSMMTVARMVMLLPTYGLALRTSSVLQQRTQTNEIKVVYIEFELLEVQVPIVSFGMAGFSPSKDVRSELLIKP